MELRSKSNEMRQVFASSLVAVCQHVASLQEDPGVLALPGVILHYFVRFASPLVTRRGQKR